MTIKCVGVLIAIIAVITVCVAQQPGPVADPEAERILDSAAHAEGRGDVLSALQTLRVKGTIYFGFAHRMSDFESIIAFPNKFRDTFSTGGGHTLTYGYDGTEAWVQSVPGEGVGGLPTIQLLLPAVQWRLRYTTAQFLGQHRMGKREAYVVRASVRGQTAAADYYYDPVSYLLLRVDNVVSEPRPLTLTYLFSDYKDVNGLKIPREWDFGMSRVEVGSVKLNVPIADKQFAKSK